MSRHDAPFSLRQQPISRGKGRSAVAAAAYRSGTRLVDERTGAVHDYTGRSGVEHSELIGWRGERVDLWNHTEAAERRRDAVVARELVHALPAELSAGARLALARDLALEVRRLTRGAAVDLNVHRPSDHPQADPRNHHVHLQWTTRAVDGAGKFAAHKDDPFARMPGPRTLRALRARAAELTNAALAREGHAVRVDHRSYAERDGDLPPELRRVPTEHMGPRYTARERDRVRLAAAGPSRDGTARAPTGGVATSGADRPPAQRESPAVGAVGPAPAHTRADAPAGAPAGAPTYTPRVLRPGNSTRRGDRNRVAAKRTRRLTDPAVRYRVMRLAAGRLRAAHAAAPEGPEREERLGHWRAVAAEVTRLREARGVVTPAAPAVGRDAPAVGRDDADDPRATAVAAPAKGLHRVLGELRPPRPPVAQPPVARPPGPGPARGGETPDGPGGPSGTSFGSRGLHAARLTTHLRGAYEQADAARRAVEVAVAREGVDSVAAALREDPGRFGALRVGAGESARVAAARAADALPQSWAPTRVAEGAPRAPGVALGSPAAGTDRTPSRVVPREPGPAVGPPAVDRHPPLAPVPTPLQTLPARARFVAARLVQYEGVIQATVAAHDAVALHDTARATLLDVREAGRLSASAEEKFEHAAGVVWTAPAKAREKLAAYAGTHGARKAAHLVRQAPGEFGALTPEVAHGVAPSAPNAVADVTQQRLEHVGRLADRALDTAAKAPTAVQVRRAEEAVERTEAAAIRAHAAVQRLPDADRLARSIARGVARLDNRQFGGLVAALPEGRAEVVQVLRTAAAQAIVDQAIAGRTTGRGRGLGGRVSDALQTGVGTSALEAATGTARGIAEWVTDLLRAGTHAGKTAAAAALQEAVTKGLGGVSPAGRVVVADLAAKSFDKALHQLAPEEMVAAVQAVKIGTGLVTNPMATVQLAVTAAVKRALTGPEVER